MRIRNLGIDRWGWSGARHRQSALTSLGARASRCLVLDLGSLDSHEEQAVVAGAVLGTLWERRAERRPVLIVIDEAHNVCPSDPPDRLTALAADYAVRIAAEGRKFGLYLLVCTQRPQKVQENVISQCDNLVLMRMASEADLAHIGELLSFAPRDLLDGATSFKQGEALVAGKLGSHPALIRFGRASRRRGAATFPLRGHGSTRYSDVPQAHVSGGRALAALRRRIAPRTPTSRITTSGTTSMPTAAMLINRKCRGPRRGHQTHDGPRSRRQRRA